MERYTIYCTEAQTRKALKLGAPIIVTFAPCEHKEPILSHDNREYICPTAEQMIGWLESNGISDIRIMLYKGREEYTWVYVVYSEGALESRQFELIKEMDGFESRKEATLAAIDAALEYLSNKK